MSKSSLSVHLMEGIFLLMQMKLTDAELILYRKKHFLKLLIFSVFGHDASSDVFCIKWIIEPFKTTFNIKLKL
jgi:hypothetical protein